MIWSISPSASALIGLSGMMFIKVSTTGGAASMSVFSGLATWTPSPGPMTLANSKAMVMAIAVVIR
ncbi:Uncharacterised protein [Mycobacterium tuberculosis]|nr:Uncharacterised protein [Mycobacterium tuberculosis]